MRLLQHVMSRARGSSGRDGVRVCLGQRALDVIGHEKKRCCASTDAQAQILICCCPGLRPNSVWLSGLVLRTTIMSKSAQVPLKAALFSGQCLSCALS